jgi:hypothetical protein
MKSMTTEKKKKEEVPLEEDLDERCVARGRRCSSLWHAACASAATRGRPAPTRAAGEHAWATTQRGAARETPGAALRGPQRASRRSQTSLRVAPGAHAALARAASTSTSSS